MRFIFKPKQSSIYRARYTVGDDPRIRDISLKTRDREEAEIKLTRLIHEDEEERKGNIAPRRVRETARRPVGELFEEFCNDLRQRGRSSQYIKKMHSRLPILFSDCGWNTVEDVHASDFVEWRSEHGDSAPKTLNHYLDSARAFLNWLVKQELIVRNPLAHLDKVDNRVREQSSRRAFTPDEILRLMANCGRNRFAYMLLLATGLRVGEARDLEWRDVHLESELPCLRLRAEATKARRADVLPIPHILAEMIREKKPDGILETMPVLLHGVPMMSTLEKDLFKAGVPLVDEHGRGVTRHTFRRTYVTFLQLRLGLPPLVAQHLARHRCLNLTDRAYTDRTQLPLGEAMEKLDAFLRTLSLPLNLPQKAVKSCPNLSGAVLMRNRNDNSLPSQPVDLVQLKSVEFEAINDDLVIKLAERGGFEPRIESAERESVASGYNSARSQLPADLPCSSGEEWAEMAELVAIWPTLAPDVRRAILILARSSKGGVR